MVQIACLSSVKIPKKSQGSRGLRAIFEKKLIWSPGSKGHITLTFGSSKCSGCSPDAAWSMIGSESTDANPSMNLGFIDVGFQDFTFSGKTFSYQNDFKDATRNYCTCDSSISCCQNSSTGSQWVPGATVIHEFCHALGMLHEHQNDLAGTNKIKLNKQNVINYYLDMGMTKQDAIVNVLDRYTCDSKDPDSCKYVGSSYDPSSIMLYALPDNWVDGPNPTKPNFSLSKTDKEWLRSRYPIENTNMPELTIEFIDNSFTGNKEQWKKYWVMKTITEGLLPIVGVKMRFVDNNGSTLVDYTPIETIKRPLLENAVSAYSGLAPAKKTLVDNIFPKAENIKNRKIEKFGSTGSDVFIIILIVCIILIFLSVVKK